MKVVVIGGAGVFGSRLARLLIRDGHDVVVAGRHKPAQVAQDIGATALQLDRSGDLAPLWGATPDVVVDAAGPFHAYGPDPYRLPREAIARGVHYLDLADDARFCAGISELDTEAKEAGVIALSGVSSVPALSSAIVADLLAGADEVDTISSAILPGNRAPRGKAVVDSILHQTGTPIDVMVDGQTVPVRSWSAARTFDLGQGIRRRAYAIRVPDQDLSPAFFNARTVTFHAGLELAVMSRGLALWSVVRNRLRLGNPRWFGRVVHRAAALLDRFGSDTGGMQVAVSGRFGDRWLTRCWSLIVRDGEGPFIPGVAARAILRDLPGQPHGAGPALVRFSRSIAEEAMSDIAVEFTQSEGTLTPLFAQVLGVDFADLPQSVQDSHATYGPRRLTGQGRVTRGAGLWPRLIAAIFGFPSATDAIPVTVIKTPVDGTEVWHRHFGSRRFCSVLSPGRTGMSERFGPFTFDLDLHVQDDALHFPVKAGRIGPIPLPTWLLPRSVAREHDDRGNFCFDVALFAPFTGQMIVHYQGTLARGAQVDAQVKET